MCKILLAHNATPTLGDRIGFSALHHVVLQCNTDMLSYLIDVLLKFGNENKHEFQHQNASDSLVARWKQGSAVRYVRVRVCIIIHHSFSNGLCRSALDSLGVSSVHQLGGSTGNRRGVHRGSLLLLPTPQAAMQGPLRTEGEPMDRVLQPHGTPNNLFSDQVIMHF